MLCSCSSVHESRSTDLTRLMCVPIPRWMPEHRMQRKTPEVSSSPSGDLGRAISSVTIKKKITHSENSRLFFLQSAHSLLASNFRRLRIVSWF